MAVATQQHSPQLATASSDCPEVKQLPPCYTHTADLHRRCTHLSTFQWQHIYDVQMLHIMRVCGFQTSQHPFEDADKAYPQIAGF